jgi:Legume lectin domain/Chitobiase/beta-hexosaminidase C-terminal domain/Fn3 associated
VFAENARREVHLSSIFRPLALLLLFASSAPAQNVTTQHNDVARTGAYNIETVLTPANVNANNFGKVFYYVVDGYVYAQPLYVANVTMGAGTPQAGTKHNVMFVATEHDSLYAFDADSNLGANGKPLWQITLLDAAHGAAAGATSVPSSDFNYTDLVPEIGITSTPVIDPSTNTLYVVGKTKESGAYIYRLHALDITTGAEKFGGPVALSGSVPGNGSSSSNGLLQFNPKFQLQRPGLLLLNGIVYIGFAAQFGTTPSWHGWIFGYGYNAATNTLQRTGLWCATPNGNGASIWNSGGGLAADVPDTTHPFGRLFIPTGNGSFNATIPYDNTMNYSISILRLDLANGVPTMNSNGVQVGDLFTPFDEAKLNASDSDQTSGGAVVLPDGVSGIKRPMVQVGKSGRIYIIDRDNLGGFNPNRTSDPQQQGGVAGQLFGLPAYWNGHLYFWVGGDRLKSFSFANGALSTGPTSSSAEIARFPGATPSVSANGANNGIVWSVQTDAFDTPGPAILYAHNALNVGSTLYSSAQNAPRDSAGNAVKFATPTIANGKVYVGTQYEVSVYGLLNGATQAAQPVITPTSQLFHPSIQVTITDSTPTAQIFYTTDGSMPSTGSTPYTGPFTVTSTQTINAVAVGTGLLASTVASETYTLVNQVPTPTFNPAPGDFASSQSAAINTTWPGSTIYYTTDGSTPTTSSTQYMGPVAIPSTSTLKAIGTAPNLTNSAVASGLYTIVPNATSSVDFRSGFTSGAMLFVGPAKLSGTHLRVTDGGSGEAAAAWYPAQVNVQGFSTDFEFQQTPGTNPVGDGMTFTIQGTGTAAVGPSGGGLGYGASLPGGTPGIPKSVAVKFDLFSNASEGNNSTGLYLNGASPTIPAITLGGGVNLQSGDVFAVHLAYDGTTLTMTITDTVDNSKTFTTSWPVDIPTTVGGNTAFVGFTGGTGHYTVVQDIMNWTYVSTATGGQQTAATPVISPGTGTFTSPQTVTITDATSGFSIFYTLDGSTPTTASTPYSASFTVTTTTTVKAIATAPNFLQSPTATSIITINAQTSAPLISPVTGTYSSPQTANITDATSGSTIFYTLDGSQPSTSSTQYIGAFTVSTTTTVKAIATAPNFTQSNTTTSVITIQSGGSTTINFASGFTATGLSFNGHAKLNGTRLQLTDGGQSEASSSWFATPVNVQAFTTDFSMQLINPNADGMTFAIQNAGTTALGSSGGGLGYATSLCGSTSGIPTSVAVKFDLFQNCQEGNNSTGLYTDGASPTSPANTLGGGVNLHSGDIFQVHMTYDGTTLTMTITDTVTNATFTTSWTINIPATVGGNAAFVGFTGGTGGQTSTQQIISWTYSSSGSTQQPAATPVISPATGTFTSPQTVTITDGTAGSTIYYTQDGSQPTTSSTQYTGSLTVSSTTTVNAIATAPNFTQSATGTSVITINQQSPAATPVISPATGTFTAPQTVTITDSTAGSTIYYTLDGSQPTTSSTQYTGSLTVSSTTTVNAIASAPNFTQSATGTSVITINQQSPAATPVISPATGTFTSPQSVTIADSTAGSTIYYTLDGSQPTTSSTPYTGSFTVSTTTTVKGFATASGFAQSATGTSVITINQQSPAATPLISPATGTFSPPQTVTITDATSGATIFYTLDGSQPTTSSTPYTGSFTVSTTTTVKGVATASGFAQSATGTSVITINQQSPAATPLISPATGTFSPPQTVTITDATSGATIFYTLDGSQPTASSTQYTGSFAVSATTTVKAIATAPSFMQSNTATSVITIQSGSTTINFASGFTATGLASNGRTTLNGTRLRLTDGGQSEASSAWFTTPVNVQSFTTDFSFQLTNPNADGMTLTIQNAGITALGSSGGGLGYGTSLCGSTSGIPTSVAVKFDLFQNCHEGNNSIGLYTDGASPTSPAITLGGGVNLHSGDVFHVHMTYDGTTLTMTITDTVTNATFTNSWTINIPGTVGGNTAFVGFTAGTGGQTATQEIITWTYGP